MTETITRDDLEGKLRQIEDVVDDATRSWVPLIIGGAVVIGAAVIAWKIMRSRAQKITVEVYTKS